MIRIHISEANITPKILVSGWYTKKTPIAPIAIATTELIRITVSICRRVFSVALLTIFFTNFICYSPLLLKIDIPIRMLVNPPSNFRVPKADRAAIAEGATITATTTTPIANAVVTTDSTGCSAT